VLKSGKISAQFHNKDIKYLQKDQILIFNPYQVHVTKNDDINTQDYYTLHLQQDWISKIKQNIYFDLNIIDDEIYYKEFLNLCEFLLNSNSNNSEALIYEFFNKFVLKYSSKLNNNSINNHLLEDVKSYILDNIKEQITLDDIANNIGYNKEYIIRIFKNEFGLTPHAFLMNEKVNYAKKLLDKNDKLSICDIAVDIGFYDQSHFTKLFKKSFATTPKKYKA
jgi:AraC-like DNA-binding protein